MGRCYLGDHIAQGRRYANILTCNTETSKIRYRLGTVSNRLLRGGGKRGRSGELN